MDTIDGMRAFSAVAAQHSFTAGAKQLGISTKLASKYVRQLEQHLGAQLLNRTTRSVTLTETGAVYYERCVPLLDQLDEIEGLVQERQSELAGPIRITAPTGFGSEQLIKAIHPFQQAHPKVAIDLHLADHLTAIVEDGFDIAIRFGKLEDSSLIARKLLSMPIVVFATPGYLAANSEPKHPKDLISHHCLLQKNTTDPQHWKFSIDNQLVSFKVNGHFAANSPRAVAQMALSGAGIGMCPLYTVEPFIQSGQLQLLFENIEPAALDLHAVYPPSRHLTARIRALIDHLVTTFSQ